MALPVSTFPAFQAMTNGQPHLAQLDDLLPGSEVFYGSKAYLENSKIAGKCLVNGCEYPINGMDMYGYVWIRYPKIWLDNVHQTRPFFKTICLWVHHPSWPTSQHVMPFPFQRYGISKKRFSHNFHPPRQERSFTDLELLFNLVWHSSGLSWSHGWWSLLSDRWKWYRYSTTRLTENPHPLETYRSR